MLTTILGDLKQGVAAPIMPITTAQYHVMLDAGILADGDPIELIDGMLVRKDRSAFGENIMKHNPRHSLLMKRLNRPLAVVCKYPACHVQVQLPVHLDDFNVPEPDFAVVRGPEVDFGNHHPQADDLLLVIEIADSSLSTDRTTKQRLYASAGIPHYWIVNLRVLQVELLFRSGCRSGDLRRTGRPQSRRVDRLRCPA